MDMTIHGNYIIAYGVIISYTLDVIRVSDPPLVYYAPGTEN